MVKDAVSGLAADMVVNPQVNAGQMAMAGGGSDTEDPEPVVPDSAMLTLYIIDATETLATGEQILSVYAYGAFECFGGWPGSNIREWQKVMFFGQQMYAYTIPCLVGDNFNLIINNKAGDLGTEQYDAIALTATSQKSSIDDSKKNSLRSFRYFTLLVSSKVLMQRCR